MPPERTSLTDEALNRRFEALAELISQGFARVDERIQELNARLHAHAARLDRDAALWQSSSPWAANHDGRSETLDRILDTQAKMLADTLS